MLTVSPHSGVIRSTRDRTKAQGGDAPWPGMLLPLQCPGLLVWSWRTEGSLERPFWMPQGWVSGGSTSSSRVLRPGDSPGLILPPVAHCWVAVTALSPGVTMVPWCCRLIVWMDALFLQASPHLCCCFGHQEVGADRSSEVSSWSQGKGAPVPRMCSIRGAVRFPHKFLFSLRARLTTPSPALAPGGHCVHP